MHIAGWIKFESATTNGVSTLGNWYDVAGTANMQVSTPDGHIDTLWTFTRWTGGPTSATYAFTPVDTSHTFVAEYNQAIVVLSFVVDTAAWRIGNINVSATRTMIASEVITITNDGSQPLIFGLQISDSAGWSPGYGAGDNRFALKAQFNDSSTPPTVWRLSEDAVFGTLDWATATRFGSGGFNVAASSTEKLWMKLQAPTFSSTYSARRIGVTLVGHISMP
jgi:hypothetical protein